MVCEGIIFVCGVSHATVIFLSFIIHQILSVVGYR